ncbi:hypothetical protein HDU67_006814 [Dinochytrium kinnereticum]|nr:hypothetical protein HDU67_006814 [Dinochytrium kinnereticum]
MAPALHEDHHDDVETASEFSEQSTVTTTALSANVPLKSGSKAALFTCLACHVAFHSAENQREHYRSDWHRYNLKRKVADLPPVNQEAFALRIKAQVARTQTDSAKSTFQGHCAPCGKSYSTENAYTNHLTSKKHKDAVEAFDKKNATKTSFNVDAAPRSSAEASKSTPTPATPSQSSLSASTSDASPIVSTKPSVPWRVQLAQAKDQEELEKLIDQKIAQAPRLELTDCLFCQSHSATLEDNMAHMALAHSFFIPDLEYLVDLPGLIKYLGEKISVGNVCIYCNGKGRALHSIEAVRDHMISKGHCKIAYEDGAEMEVADYYDFSSTWEEEEEEEGENEELNAEDAVEVAEGEEEEWEDMDDRDGYLASKTKGITLSEDETRLTLASGRTVLHRSQNPHHTYHHRRQMGAIPVRTMTAASIRDSTAIVSLAGRYASLGAIPVHTQRAALALQKEAKAQNIEFNRSYQDFRTRVGVRQNKGTMNKHYRSQIGFDS